MQGMCKDAYQLRVKTMPAPLIKTGKRLRLLSLAEAENILSQMSKTFIARNENEKVFFFVPSSCDNHFPLELPRARNLLTSKAKPSEMLNQNIFCFTRMTHKTFTTNVAVRLFLKTTNANTFRTSIPSAVSGPPTDNACAWSPRGRCRDVNSHCYLHCDFRQDKEQGERIFLCHCALSRSSGRECKQSRPADAFPLFA